MRVARPLLAMFVALALGEVWQFWHIDPSVRSDFFGLWSWSRYLAEHGPAGLYDPAVQQRFQAVLDPAHADLVYPFLYPPTYLLALWPLGHLPFGLARLVWSAATLAAYAAALSGRRGVAALAVVAPATVLCLVCGQNGLLTAALLLGGLRVAPTRPLVAGAVLGALVIKPHLALLVPVALAAAGLWRTFVAAAASALAVVLVSVLAFGLEPWRDWLHGGAATWTAVDGFVAERSALVPTMSAALRQLGAPSSWVTAGQIIAGLAATGVVWLAWRSHSPYRLLTVAVGALLATPYAFLYDMPAVSGAALLTLTQRALTSVAAGFAVAVLLLPQLMFEGLGAAVPLAAPVLLLVLAWTACAPRAAPA